jgi:threonyl-tRNA synthetase
VVGGREAASGQVAVREQSGADRGAMGLDAFVALAKERIAARS